VRATPRVNASHCKSGDDEAPICYAQLLR
jgi:hypothetical protein